LVVSNNDIGDAGAQILATAIASITELHLENCSISSEGFGAISRAICGRSQPVSCLNMMLVSRYSAGNNSHYEQAFHNSCLFAVRAGWFVSTCHLRQGSFARVCLGTHLVLTSFHVTQTSISVTITKTAQKTQNIESIIVINVC